jgi:hypothetical protein
MVMLFRVFITLASFKRELTGDTSLYGLLNNSCVTLNLSDSFLIISFDRPLR